MAEKENIIKIGSSYIEPGEHKQVKIPVGRLHSGNRISIRVNIFRSKNEGPVMLLLGGVHGDEINGVQILRIALDDGYFNKLDAGTVICIPILNVYGFINFSREVPDGKDVNRSFPGNSRGSLASRVAGVLTKKILPYVDFGIDFHSGGGSRYNYPQVRYSPKDDKAKEIAEAFAAPYMIQKTTIPKSLRRIAYKKDKPIVVYEGGEALRVNGYALELALEGILRVMKSYNMTGWQVTGPNYKPISMSRTTWVRAGKAGLFLWTKSSGQKVEKGEKLGEITDPLGEYNYTVKAKRAGYIIGHNNAPVVNQGDALFNLGYE